VAIHNNQVQAKLRLWQIFLSRTEFCLYTDALYIS